MRAIYKYSVPAVIPHFVEHILKLDYQNGVPTIWALVDTSREPEPKMSVYFVGTGWPLSDLEKRETYIGTLFDNDYVWHFFYTYTSDENLKNS